MKLNILLIIFQIFSMFDFGNSGKLENSTRIIGGIAVKINKVPYQVTILSDQKSYPFCGGSIISKKHILTAAHCIETEGPYIVLSGSDIYYTGYRNDVAKFAVHPKYEKEKPRYDIAILTLAKELEFLKTVKKIDLPEKNEKYKVNAKAIVTGFGARSEEGWMVKKLRAVEVPVFAPSKCQKYKEYVPDIICAGYDGGKKDACQGDSGGPMVLDNKLIGIVSYGIGCGRVNSPGFYTDVSKYIDYIMKETNNLKG